MLDDWAGERASHLAFLAGFVPVIAFNLVNYAAGLTTISWWTFAWTTGLGILPATVVMVVMGDQVGRVPWQWWLLLPASGLAMWLLLRRWLRSQQRGT